MEFYYVSLLFLMRFYAILICIQIHIWHYSIFRCVDTASDHYLRAREGLARAALRPPDARMPRLRVAGLRLAPPILRPADPFIGRRRDEPTRFRGLPDDARFVWRFGPDARFREAVADRVRFPIWPGLARVREPLRVAVVLRLLAGLDTRDGERFGDPDGLRDRLRGLSSASVTFSIFFKDFILPKK